MKYILNIMLYNNFKNISLLLCFFCFSCVSLKNERVKLECSDFEIKFTNNNFGDILFFDNLKKSLLSKLKLIAKKNKKNLNNFGTCVMKIDVSKSNFLSIINNEGDAGRENKKVSITYELSSSELTVSGYVDIFYGDNISGYPYSNYIKEKKNKQNELEILSEEVLIDIIKQLK